MATITYTIPRASSSGYGAGDSNDDPYINYGAGKISSGSLQSNTIASDITYATVSNCKTNDGSSGKTLYRLAILATINGTEYNLGTIYAKQGGTTSTTYGGAAVTSTEGKTTCFIPKNLSDTAKKNLAQYGISYLRTKVTYGYFWAQNTTVCTLKFTTSPLYSKCQAPTTVTIKPTDVAPGGAATLEWSGAKEGTNNKITGYEIYRSTAANGTYSKLGDKYTSTSQTVHGNASNNAYYYYKIKTIGTQSGYDSDNSSAYASLQSVYSSPKVALSINNQNSTLYVGETGANLTATWSGTNGTNNPISSYVLYKNEASIYSGAENSQTIFVKGGETYKVEAKATIANTSAESNSITAYTIVPSALNVIPKTNKFLTGRGFEFDSYTPPTVSPAAAATSITYNIYCLAIKQDGSHNAILLNSSPLTQIPKAINLPDSSKLAINQPFLMHIEAYITARDGGQSSVYWQSDNANQYRIVGPADPPKIASIKDVNSTLDSAIQTHGYGQVILTYSPATENANNGSGKNFNYTIKVTSMGNTKIVNNGDSLTYKYDLTPLNEETKVSFEVFATDENGVQTSSASTEITKFSRPKFLSNSWNLPTVKVSGNYGSRLSTVLSGSFSCQQGGKIPVTDLNYSISLGCNSVYSQPKLTAALENSSDAILYEITVPCPLSTDTTGFEQELYKMVIINQNPKPAGTMKIALYYEGFAAYPTTQEIVGFNYDYYKSLSSEVLNKHHTIIWPTTALGSSRKYANPLEKIKIELVPALWRDATGESYLGGNIAVSLLNHNKEALELREDEAGTTFAYFVYPEATAEDKKIQCTLRYTLTFNAAVEIANTIEEFITINIAKWREEEASLENINLIENNGSFLLNGSLIFPRWLCGSSYHKNFTNTVKFRLYDSTNDIFLFEEYRAVAFTDDEIFSGTNTELKHIFQNISIDQVNCKIRAEIIYTNNAGNELLAYSNIALVQNNNTTLAIRKGSLGINVASNYKADENNTATVLINSNQHTGNNAVLKIVNQIQGNAANSVSFLSLEDGGEFSSIFSTNGNNLFISNLSINPEQIAGILPLEKGGTGTTDAATFRGILGLGQTTGALPIENGGTGATTVNDARHNLITAQTIAPASIEFKSLDPGNGGYIDFHCHSYENGEENIDYTSRIAEYNAGIIDINTHTLADGNFAKVRVGEIVYGIWHGTPIEANSIGVLGADKITSGVFSADRIPALNASKITDGVLSADRIPSLNASKITEGTLNSARIPVLDASKITTGIFSADRIPSLAANKITEGTFSADRIPSLAAGKIGSGTFDVARIPGLNANKITEGRFNAARLPFKYAYGNTSASGADNGYATINYSSTGFTKTPCVIAQYSKTGDNWSGSGGAIKIYNKTKTGFNIYIGGNYNTARSIDWLAFGV